MVLVGVILQGELLPDEFVAPLTALSSTAPWTLQERHFSLYPAINVRGVAGVRRRSSGGVEWRSGWGARVIGV